jgi:hypothetical protein
LAALQQKFPQAFSIEAAPMKDITPDESGPRSEVVEFIENKKAKGSVRDKD